MRVAIIGAGVTGLLTAIEIAEAVPAAAIVVYEARHPGGGSTGLSAGLFTGAGYAQEDQTEWRRYGAGRLRALAAEGALGLRRCGFLRVALSEVAYDAQVEMGRRALVNGLDVEVVDIARIGELLPRYRLDGVRGGLWSPNDGYVDGTELCGTLAERAQAAGVRIVRAAVRGLERGAAGRILVADDGRHACDYVVNAAGPWLAQVGELLGAPVHLINQRHEACVFELPEALAGRLPATLTNVPMVEGEDEESLYFRPEGETQMIAGLHSYSLGVPEHSDPDDYQRGVGEATVETLAEQLLRVFPGVDDIRYRGGWAGLYPTPADLLPIAGPHPADERVLVAGGGGGAGISVAAPIGRTIADYLVHGEPRALAFADRLALRPAVLEPPVAR